MPAPSAPALRRTSVTRLADDLAGGRLDAAAALFHRNGFPAPMIVWSPTAWDLAHPTLRAFAKACGVGPIALEAFETTDLGWVADRLMVLEPDGDDFVYRRYGREIATTYGRDMTGRRTRDFGGHISDFFHALYTAIVRRREPALSVHSPPRAVFVSEWRRLILPVMDGEGRVVRILGVNVPDNPLRAGLEAVPLPTFAVEEDETVLFANSAARAVFGDADFAARQVTMLDYAGFALRLPPGGESVEGLPAASLRDGQPLRFRVSAKRILFRDSPIAVVVAQPE